MEKEVWKDVPGFVGLYEVSTFGRIRSLDRMAFNGVKWIPIEGRILKLYVDRDKYYHVRLNKNGKKCNCKVHRLVASVFCHNENPEKYNLVNHLDCNRTNNHFKNLDWTDNRGNTHHAKINGRFKNNGKNLIYRNQKARKPLLQLSFSGTIVNQYTHMGAVGSEVISRSQLSRALTGKTKMGAKGFLWKYIE